MAKSKSGGTRAYIRGRIGSDVYSVGKNGKGQRQQVVRSIAEQVSNPRTVAQMQGRMIMSTIMQAVSQLQPIIDHSFDGFAAGQPSISEFIRRAYKDIKDDLALYPDTGNSFSFSEYQQKGMQMGCYQVSSGNASYPAAITPGNKTNHFSVAVGTSPTYGSLKAAWGLDTDEYITLITFNPVNNANNDPIRVELLTARLSIKSDLTDSTSLTADNALEAFNIEGNWTPTVSLTDGILTFTNPDDESYFYGIVWSIVSKKSGAGYAHSTLYLERITGVMTQHYDTSLATYPTGAQQYLNGGDL